MSDEPHKICYTAQGGDSFYFLSSPNRFVNKTDFAADVCSYKERDTFLNEGSSIDCVHIIELQTIALSPNQTACDYADNSDLCYSCAQRTKLWQQIKGMFYVPLFFFMFFTPPLTLLYLILVGIPSLVEKRPNPRWLLILAVILFILSVVLWLIVPSHFFYF